MFLFKHLVEFAFNSSHDIQYNTDTYWQLAVNISLLVEIYTAEETVTCILWHVVKFLAFYVHSRLSHTFAEI